MKPQILKAIKDAGGEITLKELQRLIIGSVENFLMYKFLNSLSRMVGDNIIDYRVDNEDLVYFITQIGWGCEL